MQKFDTIQVLRGLAATLILGLHAVQGVTFEGFAWPVGSALFTQGMIGLDIFFVISGFIIYFIGFKGQRPDIGSFLEGRFWRIYPPYWAALAFILLLSVGLWLVFGDASKLPGPSKLLNSVLLLPVARQEYVLGIAWTLALELMFYLVFAATALRFGAKAFLGAMGLWYVLSIAGLFVAGDFSGWAYPMLNPVVLEFLFGALIARAFLAGGTKYHKTAFCIGVLLVLILLLGHIEKTAIFRREFIYGIPAAFLVYGAVGLSIKWPSAALLWGESSYLLYLLHSPLLMLIGRGTEEMTGFNIYSSPLAICLVMIAIIIISMVLTLHLERPYQRVYKNWMKRRRQAKPA